MPFFSAVQKNGDLIFVNCSFVNSFSFFVIRIQTNVQITPINIKSHLKVNKTNTMRKTLQAMLKLSSRPFTTIIGILNYSFVFFRSGNLIILVFFGGGADSGTLFIFSHPMITPGIHRSKMQRIKCIVEKTNLR